MSAGNDREFIDYLQAKEKVKSPKPKQNKRRKE